MKLKAAEFERTTLRGVMVRRDEVEQLIYVLSKTHLEVTIADGTAEYDNLDDVIKHRGEHPKELTLKAKDTRPGEWGEVEASIGPQFTHLSYRGEETIRVAWQDARDILRSCRSWPRTIAQADGTRGVVNAWLIFSIVIWSSVLLMEPTRRRELKWFVVSASTLISLVVIWFARRPAIRLTRKHEGGWWKKNQTQIILNAITALISFLIGFFLNKLTARP